MMRRSTLLAVVGTATLLLAACGSDAAPAADTEVDPSLSTENTASEFCVTFAALDSSSVFLHAGEDTIRPGLELQIDQMEQLRSSLPSELADTEQSLDTRLAATRATLEIYAANGFDADAVSQDPAYGDVAETIGASLQADVVSATRATRNYCGVEL